MPALAMSRIAPRSQNDAGTSQRGPLALALPEVVLLAPVPEPVVVLAPKPDGAPEDEPDDEPEDEDAPEEGEEEEEEEEEEDEEGLEPVPELEAEPAEEPVPEDAVPLEPAVWPDAPGFGVTVTSLSAWTSVPAARAVTVPLFPPDVASRTVPERSFTAPEVEKTTGTGSGFPWLSSTRA